MLDERRAHELTSDSDESDVLLRFDPDILRVLYTHFEINEENNPRRGRRAGRRGRGNQGRGGAPPTNESRIISANESQIMTDNESDIVSVNLSIDLDVSGVINTFREPDRLEQHIVRDSSNTSIQEEAKDTDNQVIRPRARVRRRRRGRGRGRGRGGGEE
jgi:hypothetical protein